MTNRSRIRAGLLALILACAATRPALADESCEPVSAAEIEAKWNIYASTPDAARHDANDKFECIEIRSDHMVVCRTLPSHYAHPTLFLRKVIKKDDGLYLKTSADTAADCGAFLKLMAELRAIDGKLREENQRGSAGAQH